MRVFAKRCLCQRCVPLDIILFYIRFFSARLRQRGKSKMSAVGAVMRKLIHIVYGVLKHQKPFDPDYGRPASGEARGTV